VYHRAGSVPVTRLTGVIIAEMAAYDFITFDCYGTLIDWENGIANAFLAAAAGDGVTLDRDAVLREYAKAERALEADSYRQLVDVIEAI